MTAISMWDPYRHVSELAIDRRLAGELSAHDAAAVDHHALVCTRCSAALDDARALQREIAAAPLPRLPVPRRRAWPAVIGAATALAAALAVVVSWPRGEHAGIRTKGGAIVGFVVAHGDAVRRGATREAVMPGDRVELFTTTTEPAWFAAISSDGSVYVEPRRIEPGREQVVPAAIELDDQLRDEVVSGVFCAEPFAAREIDPATPPASCTVDRFTLVKVPR